MPVFRLKNLLGKQAANRLKIKYGVLYWPKGQILVTLAILATRTESRDPITTLYPRDLFDLKRQAGFLIEPSWYARSKAAGCASQQKIENRSAKGIVVALLQFKRAPSRRSVLIVGHIRERRNTAAGDIAPLPWIKKPISI